jgi:hypothetical protein
MKGLNNEIKDVLSLFGNVPQQLQGFITFLQWLNNRISTQQAEKMGN